jgi:hypothetical protein
LWLLHLQSVDLTHQTHLQELRVPLLHAEYRSLKRLRAAATASARIDGQTLSGPLPLQQDSAATPLGLMDMSVEGGGALPDDLRTPQAIPAPDLVSDAGTAAAAAATPIPMAPLPADASGSVPHSAAAVTPASRRMSVVTQMSALHTPELARLIQDDFLRQIAEVRPYIVSGVCLDTSLNCLFR